MNARRTVVTILSEFDRHPGNLERLIERNIAGMAADHRDRRFIFELVYGVVRHRIRLDYVLDQFLADKKSRQNPQLMHLLRLGAYQILYLDKVPHHAAVNESVNLAKQSPKTVRCASMVNAVLRAIINCRGQVPMPDSKTDLPVRLSVEFSHPEWMVRRWLAAFGLAKTRKLLAFNNHQPQLYIRRRLRGISRQSFETESRPFCESAGGYLGLYYRLTKPIAVDTIALLRGGYGVVQAPSAGWVTALLDVRPGDHCVDICSAPGGKATLMAELAGPQGWVCACERRLVRLEKLQETRERMGLTTVFPVVCDGAAPAFGCLFDKVLLDAPCSGTGVVNHHPDARVTRAEADIAKLTEVQATLLDSAARLVRPGGLLVYATCSLESEENEQQVSGFLKNHGEFALERPPQAVPAQFVDLEGLLRITPFEHDLDGMFAARLRRRGSGL